MLAVFTDMFVEIFKVCSGFSLIHSSTFITAGKQNAWWPLSPLRRSRRGSGLLQLVEYTRLVYLYDVVQSERQEPEAKKQQEIDGPAPQKQCHKLHDAMIWEIQISEATSHRPLLRWFSVSHNFHTSKCKNPIDPIGYFPQLPSFWDILRHPQANR